MVQVVKLLHQSLKPFLSRLQPVLLWDALGAHLQPAVLREAGRLGIWVLVIPARITWLLQPADTHCFAKYKAFLRKRYLEAAADSVDGRVSLDAILNSMNAAIRCIFQKSKWRHAFEGNGFGDRQRRIRESILQHLEWTALPHIPSSLPTLQQLSHIWPKRVDVPIDALFTPFLDRAVRVQPPRTAIPIYADDSQGSQWEGRLRLRPASRSDFTGLTPAVPAASTASHPPVHAAAAPCPAAAVLPTESPAVWRRVRARPIPPCRR